MCCWASQGTFYRTGPGMFDINGNPLHVFDGATRVMLQTDLPCFASPRCGIYCHHDYWHIL